MSKRIKTLNGPAKKQKILAESESSSSDAENSDLNLSGSDLELGDDEVDFDEESEQCDDNENEKQEQKGGEERDKFAESMAKILDSKVKAYDRENPILIRSKKMAKDIDDSRLEAKARAALRAEKLRNKDRARVKHIVPVDPEEAGDALSREKQLRKTAQRGVIRLMNAINQAQRVEHDGVEEKKQDKVMELSKDKFLDVIRGG